MSATDLRHSGRMKWLLIAAVGLLLLNVFSDPAPGVVAPTSRDAQKPAETNSRATGPGVAMALQRDGARPMLEPARRDPFAPAPPPAPVVVKAAPPPTVPVAAPTPAAPTAPPLNIAFAGRIVGPDGKQVIYVSFAETSLPIEQGTILPNGYRVENISAESIEFNFLALNTSARLAIPPTPRYETR